MSTEETSFEQVQSTWHDRQAEHDRRFAELLPANKAILLGALAAAGITEVVVSYDGAGDEGRIEMVEATANGEDVDIPGIFVALSIPPFETGTPTPRQQGLPDAIASFAEDLLYRRYPWWEDGDGAYGEVVFDVAAGMIRLDHNVRYTATNSFQVEF